MSYERDQAQRQTTLTTTSRERAWLLRLGELTVLAGVAGLGPAWQVRWLSTVQEAAAGLPPGLYEPSAEHLVHVLGARDAPLVPRGAETDFAVPGRSPFQPLFFSHHELDVVHASRRSSARECGRSRAVGGDCLDRLALAERQRDPPCRTEASSRCIARSPPPTTGEARVVELETVDSQAIVRTGLKLLDQQSRERFGDDFLGLAATALTDLRSRKSAARRRLSARSLLSVPAA